MDNPTFPRPEPPHGPHTLTNARFVPDRRFTVAAAAGTLVAVLVAALTTDRIGRLLVLVAAAVLACYAIGDLVFSPRIAATAQGVVIRSPFTRATLRWDEIESVRVVSRLRLGLRNTALEVDAGPTLAEFTRRSLGVDPDVACAQLLDLRPR